MNMMMKLTLRLREKLPAEVNFSIGKWADKTTWTLDGGTPEQRAAAQAILNVFDPVAVQAEIAAKEQAEREYQTWLKTSKKKIVAIVDTTVPTVEQRLSKIEAWMIKQGYKP